MIKVYSHIDFNNVMKSKGIDDSNVENENDSIFISITNRNGEIEHWFKENHKNVINLDFDDISSDNEELKTISDKQAESLMFFIDDNLSKNKDDIDVYIHCLAGMSRSRAVAEYIKRHYDVGYDKRERDLYYNYLNHDVLNRLERKYRDYIMEYIDKNKNIQKVVVEIKPYSETIPPKRGKKREKTFLAEVLTYEKNHAKWTAAKKFCEENNMKFIVLTEFELGIK